MPEPCHNPLCELSLNVNEETVAVLLRSLLTDPLDIERGGRVTAPLEESKASEIVFKQNRGSTIPDVEKS
jgi:hypothetical protein